MPSQLPRQLLCLRHGLENKLAYAEAHGARLAGVGTVPGRVAAAAREHPALTRVAVVAILALWPVVWRAAVLFEGLLLTLRVLTQHRAPLPSGATGIALGTHWRVGEQIGRVTLAGEQPAVVLLVPGIRRQRQLLARLPAGVAAVRLDTVVGVADVARAARMAWAAVADWTARHQGGARLFALVRVPTWCLAWQSVAATTASGASLWFANHQDEWAALAAGVPGPVRRHLLQHGVEPHPVAVPHRLRGISDVHLYSPTPSWAEPNREFMRRAVLAEGEEPRWHALAPGLPLQPRAAGAGPIVLVLGGGFDSLPASALLAALRASLPGVSLAFRPHPLHRPGHLPAGVTVVPADAMAPAVDVVVSPASTLGLEYEASGIPVVWWSAGREVQDIATAVARELEARVA